MEGGEIRMKSPSKKIVIRNEGGKGRGRCGDRLGDTLISHYEHPSMRKRDFDAIARVEVSKGRLRTNAVRNVDVL